MKRSVGVLIMCLVLFAIGAQAAPARQLTQEALSHQDVITRVQPLCDLTASVATGQNIEAFTEDTAPGEALLTGMLTSALQSGLTAFKADGNTAKLTLQEAEKVLDSLFFSDTFSAISNDEILRLDLTKNPDPVGAFIYDIAVSPEELIVFADIYRLSGIRASVAEAPEDSLVWLGNIRIRLVPELGCAAGYSLAGFSVRETYGARGFVLFEQKGLFEVRYPDVLEPAADGQGGLLRLMHIDGNASLLVSAVPGSPEDISSAWLQETPGLALTRCQITPECRVSMRAPGLFRVAVENMVGDTAECLVLELRYPENRELEYSLYIVFIDNSFIVYSNAVG
jgi:hypothetical protein